MDCETEKTDRGQGCWWCCCFCWEQWRVFYFMLSEHRGSNKYNKWYSSHPEVHQIKYLHCFSPGGLCNIGVYAFKCCERYVPWTYREDQLCVKMCAPSSVSARLWSTETLLHTPKYFQWNNVESRRIWKLFQWAFTPKQRNQTTCNPIPPTYNLP